MLSKMRETRINRNMAYLIIGILAITLVITNANSLNQQAQYTIYNEIIASTYVDSDNLNPNTAANPADDFIRIQVALDSLTGVTGVSATIHDRNDNYMGITVDLAELAGTTSYQAVAIDVSGLPELRMFVKCVVMASGETAVNQPSDVEIYIDHPAVPIVYEFGAYQDDALISQTDEVSGFIAIKVKILSGTATGGFIHLYRGTKDVEYQDKIGTVIGLDDLLVGYLFDGDSYKSGDYWAQVSVTGNSEWEGFQDSISINLRTLGLDPITSDIKLYNFEDTNWVFVEDGGTLHGTIQITAEVTAGTAMGYALEIMDSVGNSVGTYAFTYNSGNDIWTLEYDTTKIVNGIYVFSIFATDATGHSVPQSAWSLGIWAPADPAAETNYLIWVGAFGLIVVMVFVAYKKKREMFF